RRGGAQVGAGTAAQVHHRDLPPLAELAGEQPAQLLVTGAMVGRLAQVEPGRIEAAHGAMPPITPAMMRAVASQRCRVWAAPQAASLRRRRKEGSSRTRRTASLSAATSAGGTLRAAASGTVEAAAPPVVQTMGSPRAIASASTMP